MEIELEVEMEVKEEVKPSLLFHEYNGAINSGL